MTLASLIDPSTPVLVAVSGGADSVALLYMLISGGYHCVAAHCNFHLRGEEADRDEAFVRDLCHRLGVELLVAHFDTKAYAAEHHQSIEMAARELRYNWFASILDERQIPVVAVAHHADDAAETTILNMTRGTGLRGLTGMKPKTGRVVRPMLTLSRMDIENYCRANGLTYVNDSSNASDDFARNKIRHHVIPALKGLNPSLLATMRANSEHLQGVYAIFRSLVDDFVKANVRREPSGNIAIDAEALRRQVSAEPFLFEILTPKGFSPRQVADMARCVEERQSGRIFLAAENRIVVDRSAVILTPPPSVQDTQAVSVIGASGGEAHAPAHVVVTVRDVSAGFAPSRDPKVLHLDAGSVTFPLTLRRWRKGDAFRPLGMKGEKKLSDFFVDRKMSIPQKEAATVLVSANGRIACIVGMRMDDRCKVSGATRRVVEVRLL